MESDWLYLEDVSRLTGRAESSLRRICNTGQLGVDAKQTPWGQRLKWQIHISAVGGLKPNNQVPDNQYKSLVQRWKSEQLNVYKLKPETVERNYYGLRSFWRYLANDPKDWEYKEEQDLSQFTIQSIRQSMANTSKVENIYKSTMSFYNFLVREGLRSETDLLRFKKFKPAKNKNPKRTFIRDDDDFKKLIEKNLNWTDGRTKYDQLLASTILQLGYHTGLRNSEMCNLKLHEVSLKTGVILVYKGKGDKTRRVGIRPELETVLKEFLKKRPKTDTPNLLVQADGGPMNRRTVWRRIKNLGEAAGVPIKPHGLRNTFITNLLMDGVPSVKVQKIVGHEHLETTELYDMSSDEDALDVLRGPRKEKKKLMDVIEIAPVNYY